MKRITAIILLAAMMLCLAACGQTETAAPKGKAGTAQDAAVTQQNQQAHSAPQLVQTAPESTPEPTPEPTPEVHEGIYTFGVNALLNSNAGDGFSVLCDTDPYEVTAVAKIPEGMVFDHWEINGEAQNSGGSGGFTFTAGEDTVVEAIYTRPKIVTSKNAYMQFVWNNSPVGSKFYSLDFGKQYEGFTGTEPGGSVTFYITAEIPSGYEIDYWLIDGVKYFFGPSQNRLQVENLKEAATYEPVFKTEGSNGTSPGSVSWNTEGMGKDLPAYPGSVKANEDCGNCVYAVDALVNGMNKYTLGGTETVTVRAIVPDGKVFDSWEINGVEYRGCFDAEMRIEVSQTTLVRAHFRNKATVEAINSYLNVLDGNAKPASEDLKKLMFDEPYAVGSEQRQGYFNGYLWTEMASGYVCAGWKINDVPHYFMIPASVFRVSELQTDKTYEPILYYNPTYTGTVYTWERNPTTPGYWWNGPVIVY